MSIKPVKYFSSAMAGAPALNTNPGSAIAVLDACLVNGFNLLTLDSLTVVNQVLIGTKSGHGFVVDQVVATSGASQFALNGEWTITETTSNTFKASAAGVADLVGTGLINVKAASAGWEKVFSGENTGAYRSQAVESTGCVLRIDDTTQWTRARGFLSMTDIDTGADPFPTDDQIPGGGYIAKNDPTPWMVIADNKTLWLLANPRPNNPSAGYRVYFFGDYPSERVGDGYSCAIQVFQDGNIDPAEHWTNIGLAAFTNGKTKLFSCRSYNQLGDSVQMLSTFQGTAASGSNGGFPYPSAASNGIVLSPISVLEVLTNTLRCLAWPGVFATPQAQPLNHGSIIRNVGPASKTILTTSIGIGGNGVGRLFFDLTGPWQ